LHACARDELWAASPGHMNALEGRTRESAEHCEVLALAGTCRAPLPPQSSSASSSLLHFWRKCAGSATSGFGSRMNFRLAFPRSRYLPRRHSLPRRRLSLRRRPLMPLILGEMRSQADLYPLVGDRSNQRLNIWCRAQRTWNSHFGPVRAMVSDRLLEVQTPRPRHQHLGNQLARALLTHRHQCEAVGIRARRASRCVPQPSRMLGVTRQRAFPTIATCRQSSERGPGTAHLMSLRPVRAWSPEGQTPLGLCQAPTSWSLLGRHGLRLGRTTKYRVKSGRFPRGICHPEFRLDPEPLGRFQSHHLTGQ